MQSVSGLCAFRWLLQVAVLYVSCICPAAELVAEPDFSSWRPYPKAVQPQKGFVSRLQHLVRSAGL